ncbi:hypothetical protein [Streptomyces chartreusis]|uniref:hypothetical protein n=1 Tax=Streptomyces chartreusis TaxID=1969 RepID=UPI003695C2C8
MTWGVVSPGPGDAVEDAVTDPDTGASTTTDPGEQFDCLEAQDQEHRIGGTLLCPFSTGIDCEDLGLRADDLSSATEPQPGQFLRSTTAASVPNTQAGRLEFSDRAGVLYAYINTQPTL